MQYFEKNGRNRGNPWSLRQTGVYQQVTLTEGISNWIILQPSNSCRSQLDKIMQSNTRGETLLAMNPMLLHLHFLTAMAGQWEEYIQNLHDSLKELVSCFFYSIYHYVIENGQDDKASFSAVGHKRRYDFSVAFADSQKLHLLRQKLFQAQVMLQAALDTTAQCIRHCHQLDKNRVAIPCGDIITAFQVFNSETNVHQRKIRTMIRISNGTEILVCQSVLILIPSH